MAGNITYVPRQRSGFQEFVDIASPYLQVAFQNYMKQKLDTQQSKQTYSEAERMGLINKTPIPQTAETSMGTVPIRPDPSRPQQYQYSLNQQPGIETSMEFGAGGIPKFGQKTVNPIDQQYKESQLNINTEILKSIKKGTGGDLVYRDISTGQEVPQEEALKNTQQGVQYIINRRITSRQGIKEEPVAKPEDLSQEEKQYLVSSKRILGSLDTLQNDIYPKLDKMGGNKDWQSMQAQNLPFWAIGNQDIEDFKSSLVQLKADIPFLRGGKQLTPKEAERVDILLNPFGKSEETRQKDIKRFQDEFISGAELMKGGIRTLNRETQKQDSNPLLKLGLDPNKYEIVR